MPLLPLVTGNGVHAHVAQDRCVPTRATERAFGQADAGSGVEVQHQPVGVAALTRRR